MAKSVGHVKPLVLSLIVLAMLASTTWITAAAPGSQRKAEAAMAVQPAVEVYDFLQINIAESGGDTVTFGDGRQICLSVTVDPPLTPGGTPWITHCYGSLPNQTLHANRPTTPFLRSSSYSIAVASNDTGCEVSTPAMTPADYGPGSGWYAIFKVTADCPAAPPPPTATTAPPPTATIAPPPTATTAPLPTATTIPSPTATTAPPPTATDVPPDEYNQLVLWYSPVGTTPPVLSGPVCALIVADPPFTGASLYEVCSSNSSTNFGFGGIPGEPFPTSSVYTATIVSNDSGCLVTTGPLREGTGDVGFLGIVDVFIDCDSDPAPTATLSPTATATSPASPTPTATMSSTASVVPSPTATSPATAAGSVPPTDDPPPTETIPATDTMMTPSATIPATVSASETSTAPSSTATDSPGLVTNLPTTGAGPMDQIPQVLLLALGGLLLLLGAKGIRRNQTGR